MKPTKISHIACFDIYASLIEERQNREEAFYRHPTQANKDKIIEVREQLNQMHAIYCRKANLFIWS